jgi:hypothetical protein
MIERLRLYQLPLAMDPLLAGLNPGTPSPFEDSPSPEIYTLLFCQLWGTCVGGFHGTGKREVAMDAAEMEVKEDAGKGKVAIEAAGMEVKDDVKVEVKEQVEVKEEVMEEEEMVGRMVKRKGKVGRKQGEAQLAAANGLNLFAVSHCEGGNTQAMGNVMTVSSIGPDTPTQPPDTPTQPEAALYVFDFDFEVNTQLTNKDTITSLASEETLCRSSQMQNKGKREDDPDDPEDDPEDKLGPSPMKNPGPPFKVGDIILCDIPGQLWGMDLKVNWLQRGFVMEANHPSYKIRLDKGATVWTNTQESWLQPRWATKPGTQFAADQDDPFADMRSDPTLRIGSYGIHVNTQHDLLEKIAKVKTHAKAVKADDAAVPVQLWNDQIVTPAGTKVDGRDAALETFCTLGHRWFLRGLIRDAIAYIRETYTTGWTKPRRTKEGELTKFGKD